MPDQRSDSEVRPSPEALLAYWPFTVRIFVGAAPRVLLRETVPGSILDRADDIELVDGRTIHRGQIRESWPQRMTVSLPSDR
jgi:hypothetical protein